MLDYVKYSLQCCLDYFGLRGGGGGLYLWGNATSIQGFLKNYFNSVIRTIYYYIYVIFMDFRLIKCPMKIIL